jgi:hypothetical protein
LDSDFQRALHARPIAREEFQRSLRVEPPEHFVQMQRAAPRTDCRQATPQVFIRLRRWKERIAQRTQIKSCAADKQSHPSTGFNLFYLPGSRTRPFARRVIYFRRHEINQVMRHASTLLQRNLGRRNLYLTINLHGIAVDNLAAEAQGQLYPKLAFAGSRRANDCGDWF